MSVFRLFVLCGLAWPATAAADDVKQECSAAYDKVQTLRQTGKLTAARREAVVCAREGCTDFIKADCAKWVGELNASTPTVVFAVKDASGADTLNVRVSLDGRVFAEQLDGKAVAIDPGAHKLRFELAGSEPIENDVVILEGAQARRIDVSFKKDGPPAEVPGAPIAVPTRSAPLGAQTLPRTGMKVTGIVLTSLAIGLLVSGVTMLAVDSANNGNLQGGPGALGIDGIAVMLVSIGPAVAGASLWAIGSKGVPLQSTAVPVARLTLVSGPDRTTRAATLTWTF